MNKLRIESIIDNIDLPLIKKLIELQYFENILNKDVETKCTYLLLW